MVKELCCSVFLKVWEKIGLCLVYILGENGYLVYNTDFSPQTCCVIVVSLLYRGCGIPIALLGFSEAKSKRKDFGSIYGEFVLLSLHVIERLLFF